MHPLGLNAEIFATPFDQSFNDEPASETLPARSDMRIPLLQPLGSVLTAAREDVVTSENKPRTVASGLGVVATQVVGPLKVPSILTFSAAMEGLELTGSPIMAGFSGAACYGILSLIGLRTISNGVKHYAGAFQTAGDNFPRLTRGFSKALPGFEASMDQERKPASEV